MSRILHGVCFAVSLGFAATVGLQGLQRWVRRIGSQTRAGLSQTGTGYCFQFAAAHARVAEMGGRRVVILHLWR